MLKSLKRSISRTISGKKTPSSSSPLEASSDAGGMHGAATAEPSSITRFSPYPQLPSPSSLPADNGDHQDSGSNRREGRGRRDRGFGGSRSDSSLSTDDDRQPSNDQEALPSHSAIPSPMVGPPTSISSLHNLDSQLDSPVVVRAGSKPNGKHRDPSGKGTGREGRDSRASHGRIPLDVDDVSAGGGSASPGQSPKNSLHKTASFLLGSTASKNAEILTLQDEVRELREKLSSQRTASAASEHKHSQLIDELQTQNAQLTAQNAQLKSQTQHLLAAITKLEANLEAAEASARSKAQECLTLSRRVTQLETKVQECHLQNDMLTRDISSSEARLNEALQNTQSLIKDLGSRGSLMLSQEQALREVKMEQSATLSHLLEEKHRLVDALTTSERELTELRDAQITSNDNVRRLQEQLVAASRAAEVKLAVCNEEMLRLRTALEEESEAAHRSVDQARAECAEWKMKYEEFEKGYRLKMEAVETEHEHAREHGIMLVAQRTEIDRLNRELSSTSAALAELRSTHTDLKSRLDACLEEKVKLEEEAVELSFNRSSVLLNEACQVTEQKEEMAQLKHLCEDLMVELNIEKKQQQQQQQQQQLADSDLSNESLSFSRLLQSTGLGLSSTASAVFPESPTGNNELRRALLRVLSSRPDSPASVPKHIYMVDHAYSQPYHQPSQHSIPSSSSSPSSLPWRMGQTHHHQQHQYSPSMAYQTPHEAFNDDDGDIQYRAISRMGSEERRGRVTHPSAYLHPLPPPPPFVTPRAIRADSGGTPSRSFSHQQRVAPSAINHTIPRDPTDSSHRQRNSYFYENGD